MVKIGLISDTHFRPEIAREAIEILKGHEVNLILHAGDIVELETLKDLKNSNLPYAAVLGNNDYHLAKFKEEFELFNEPHIFKFENLTIKLMHHPKFLSANADIIAFGHTHSFTAVLNNYSLFINPGEICGRKYGNFTFALLCCQDKNFQVFKFIKTPQDEKFNEIEVNLG